MALPRAHGAGVLPKACDARKHVSRGPHMGPSLTASRARIQASEEPLGQSRWAGGTLWDSGRGLEGRGVQRQSKRAEDAPTPPSDMPGQCGHGWTVPEKGEAPDGSSKTDRQTDDSSWT